MIVLVRVMFDKGRIMSKIYKCVYDDYLVMDCREFDDSVDVKMTNDYDGD